MEQNIFYKDKAAPLEEREIWISGRFQRDGKELPWRIRAMRQEENLEIQKSRSWEEKEYLAEVIARCVVFPDLRDAALQDSYKAMGAEKLITTMLTPGEFEDYSAKVLEVNGFQNVQELVDEAKN